MITNYNEIVTTKTRKDAIDIALAGINAVLPSKILSKKAKFDNNVLDVDGSKFNIGGNIYVIGGGKASGLMAKQIELILGLENIAGGFVNDKTMNAGTEKIIVNRAGHPIPDESSLEGTKKILELTKNLKKEDLVICLISGGGSALLELPVDGISLEEIKELTGIMLKSSAEVFELNILRKHLSKIKGGKLAKYLQPATVVSLIISDTIDTTYDSTASGPTSPDKSTFLDAYNILKKYDLLGKAPKNIVEYIVDNVEKAQNETLKSNDHLFENVHNFILVDNIVALNAMEEFAKKIGYEDVEIVTHNLKGESKDVAKKMAGIFRNSEKGKVFLYGGETTVSVKGNGRGGRLQEYIASLIPEINSLKNCAAVAFGSDGVDFVEGVAGAVADNCTLEECMKKNLEVNKFIEENNTYELHKSLGNLIRANLTNTNVADLHVFILGN